MGKESGGGGSPWELEADRTTSSQTQGKTGATTENLRGVDENQEPGAASTGVSVGAGMGGFMSYDSAGPVSTSLDDTGDGEGEGGGDGMTADQGSTGGRSAGQR